MLGNPISTPLGRVPVKFKRLPNGAGLPMPTYTNSDAVGMDISAAHHSLIAPGKTVVVKTGWAVELLKDYEIQVRSRSGLAAKYAVFATNSPGTIDPDYRGELMVILTNLGPRSFDIQHGDRIAQLVLAPVYRAEPIEVESLGDTDRGEGGLGSTGR
jgi:dUTP pyrophosphatase